MQSITLHQFHHLEVKKRNPLAEKKKIGFHHLFRFVLNSDSQSRAKVDSTGHSETVAMIDKVEDPMYEC